MRTTIEHQAKIFDSERDVICEKDVKSSVFQFKSALAESLLSLYPAEKRGKIYLDSIPEHTLKEGQRVIRQKVFGERITSEQLKNFLIYTYCYSATQNYLIAAGLRENYDVESLVHRKPEEYNIPGLHDKIEVHKVEVVEDDLRKALEREIPSSKNIIQTVISKAKKFGNIYSLTVYEESFPNFLFAVWVGTGELPKDYNFLTKEKQNGELGKNFYTLSYGVDTIKELANYFEGKLGCKLTYPSEVYQRGK